MRKLLLILTFLGLFNTYSNACSCKTIENLKEFQELSYTQNDLIFIGETIESNEDGTFKIKIVELFKGTVQDSIISGKAESSCSLQPFIHEI